MRSNQVGGAYDSNHIYYNITINNSDNTGAVPAPPVVFNEIRNAPYLTNPNDYFMSVIRFSLESSTLPVFIPQAKLGQSDINKLVYAVTIEWNNGVSTYSRTLNVQYVAENVNARLPAPPVDFIDLKDNYYYVYSYEWFIQMINTTLADAFNDVNAQLSAVGGSLPSSNPPVLTWDSNSFKASLNCELSTTSTNYYDTSQPNPIKIFFNAPLYNLFSSFKANYLGTQAGDLAYQLMISNQYFNVLSASPSVDVPGFPYPVIRLTQEYPTTPLWTPVQSIVFTTAFLPVVPELTAVPKFFGVDSKFFNVGNNSNITSTLTDFEMPLVTGSEYKPLIQYNPTAEYRLVDLFGNNPISAIEIRIYWKDEYSNLIPLTLAPGASASVKIMFRKKDFNNGNLK